MVSTVIVSKLINQFKRILFIPLKFIQLTIIILFEESVEKMIQSQNPKQVPLEPFNFEIRPDIDGLRAICVVAVIICHLPADINTFLKYGFLGVPVFFVMSGYLITAVILRDLTRNKFTFQGFYERRIKRVLPNLMLCVIVNFIVAYSFTTHNKIGLLSYESLGAFLMVNNFMQAYLEGHFWTLAIEQHFYLVWPLVVPFLLRQSLKTKIIILAIASLVSFALLAIKVGTAYISNPGLRDSSTFFWAWNILMGCMLTFIQYERQKEQSKALRLASNNELNQESANKIQQTKKEKEKSTQVLCQIFANAITFIAFVTLMLMIIFGLPFLQPWVGIQYCVSRFGAAFAAFILINYKGTFIAWILSLRFLRFIGRQSYSLYLWHYPYIRFVHDLGVNHWLKGILLIFPLVACYFQDKITNSKERTTFTSIICIYAIAIGFFLTFYLTAQQ